MKISFLLENKTIVKVKFSFRRHKYWTATHFKGDHSVICNIIAIKEIISESHQRIVLSDLYIRISLNFLHLFNLVLHIHANVLVLLTQTILDAKVLIVACSFK